MKKQLIGLAACVVVLVIGLGLFTLLLTNGTGTLPALPASPTTQALAATSTMPAESTKVPDNPVTLSSPAYYTTPAATAAEGAQTWSTFSGRYFTIRVPPSWTNTNDNSGDVNQQSYSAVVEDTEWRINGIDRVYVHTSAHYQPYSEWVRGTGSTPFQAGSLNGVTRTWAYTDTGFTDIEIVLPGTPDNIGPICYTALLEMPSLLSQDQQDSITRQFREAVAQLAPSQEALQSTPTAIPAPPGVGACSAGSLSAKVDGQGCTGRFCGIITLTNTGQTTCSISGRPIMKYISHDGKSLPVSQDSLPPATGNAKSAVVLKPGGSTVMSFLEPLGGCSREERVPVTAAWVMELPSMSGQVTLHEESALSVCSNNLPVVSSMEVGTFESVK
jgi:hypothetical protein